MNNLNNSDRQECVNNLNNYDCHENVNNLNNCNGQECFNVYRVNQIKVLKRN